MTTMTTIGKIKSVSESNEFSKNNWPHKNTMIANGSVSRSGAFDDTSPSRFNPLLRLINEPVLSPIKQANPKNEPRIKADIPTEPKSNQVPSYPVNG